MSKFGGYSEEDLSKQYNPQEWASDIEAVGKSIAAKNQAARDMLRFHPDIAYGDQPEERLDIFPAHAANAPVHVFFHGGGWIRGAKETACYATKMFVLAGAIFVAVNFVKIDKAPLEEIVRQSQAAVAWVFQNIAEYGGDPSQIYVSGKSSGAQQASMVVCADWSKFDLPGDVVKGGVLISGSYNLEPHRHTARRQTMGFDDDLVQAMSAIHNIPPAACPLVIGIAENDAPELHRQARELAAAWKAAGFKASLVEEPGVDHFSIGHPMGDKTSLLGHASLAQMGLV